MIELLTCSDALAAFCDRASKAEALALDTEFMRERTYYPELCLIQAALPDEIVLIDPLSELDLSPLAQLMASGGDKILHACRQDQEVLVAALKSAPMPLFDTQHAAALCGFPPQWSYAALVTQFSGVELAKTATRTDWSRRPLSTQQLEYAADDVRYLIDIRAQLMDKLAALGRLDWFAQDMRAMESQPLDVEPMQAWQRVKGKGLQQGRPRAVLQTLAAWRELRGQSRNRPRRWVLSDEALLAIANAQPQTVQALAALSDVPEGVVRNQGSELLDCVAQAQDLEIPHLEQRIPDKAVIAGLQTTLRKIAQELELDSSLLATRADLNALVLDGHSPRLQNGWRADVVGDVLAGQL